MSNERRLRRKKRKVRDQALAKFETVYTVCKEIGNHYDTGRIPIAVLKVVIDKSLLITVKGINDEAVQKDFMIKMNDTLRTIYTTCYKKAKSMKGSSIPFAYLRHAIDVVKSAFEESNDW